jgi:hypothetical protein
VQEDEVLAVGDEALLLLLSLSLFGVSRTREAASVSREAHVLLADLHPAVFVYVGFRYFR